MIGTELLVALVLAVVLAVIVGLLIHLAGGIRDWWIERWGRHVVIEPFSAITRVRPGGEVILRFRVRGKVHRSIPVQISYGDDPSYLAKHPELLPWAVILEPAAFLIGAGPSTSSTFTLAPMDTKDVEMRMRAKRAGRTAIFVSGTSRGFGAKWSVSPPYPVEVDPDLPP